MERGGTLEMILVGALVFIVIFFFFRPNMKQIFQKSKETPSDWKAVVLPLGGVVLFIVLLIALVRG